MFDHIVERFLRNAIQRQLHFARESPFLPRFTKIHNQIVGLADFARQHFQRSDQSQVFEINGAQRTRETA
jgi:hypothetical protein